MGKKIIAVNAGPRMGWNTETLITYDDQFLVKPVKSAVAMLPEPPAPKKRK